jgi:hypothetical protein
LIHHGVVLDITKLGKKNFKGVTKGIILRYKPRDFLSLRLPVEKEKSLTRLLGRYQSLKAALGFEEKRKIT